MNRSKKSKLVALDAFAKTEEEVRIRTNAGGLITLSCVVLALYLLFNEWRQFQEVVIRPKLVVDRDRDLKLDLNIDISFPHVPCDLINLDIMDDAGDVQLEILKSGFTKTRIGSNGEGSDTYDFKVGEKESIAEYPPDDENYCGPCYGAKDQSHNEDASRKEDKVCCQTCQDVQNAYVEAGWAFFDGKNIEQCEREGYVKDINSHLNEGCRVNGTAKLNRIQGNIHFAPGRAFQNQRGHFHDISLYSKIPTLTFEHTIHHLSFGKPIETKSSIVKEGLKNTAIAPMDGRHVVLPTRDTHFHQFSYYIDIVPTRYEYLDKSVIETAQYSATYHSKPLRGGSDEDHPTTLHSRAETPGLFLFFGMAPLKVINRERYAQTWSGFLLACITSIGGVLAVGTVLDKVFYKAQKTIFSKKNQ